MPCRADAFTAVGVVVDAAPPSLGLDPGRCTKWPCRPCRTPQWKPVVTLRPLPAHYPRRRVHAPCCPCRVGHPEATPLLLGYSLVALATRSVTSRASDVLILRGATRRGRSRVACNLVGPRKMFVCCAGCAGCSRMAHRAALSSPSINICHAVFCLQVGKVGDGCDVQTARAAPPGRHAQPRRAARMW